MTEFSKLRVLILSFACLYFGQVSANGVPEETFSPPVVQYQNYLVRPRMIEQGLYNQERELLDFSNEIGNFHSFAEFVQGLPAGSVWLDGGTGYANVMAGYFSSSDTKYFVKNGNEFETHTFVHNHGIHGISLAIRDPGIRSNVKFLVRAGKMEYVIADLVEYAKQHPNSVDVYSDSKGPLAYLKLDVALNAIATLLKPKGRAYFSLASGTPEFLRFYLSKSSGLQWIEEPNPQPLPGTSGSREVGHNGYFLRTEGEPYFPSLDLKQTRFGNEYSLTPQ